MKNLKRHYLLLFLAVLFLISSNYSTVLADIAVPQAKSVEIKTSQNFSDFEFYFCEVPVTSYYDKGRHYTYHYENLTLKPVKFSAGSPFLISQKNFSDGMYFFAVDKDTASAGNLKSKVADALQKKDADGIYFFSIDTSEDDSHEDENARNVIYTIVDIDDSGIKTTREFSDSVAANKFFYVGIGLALTGLIFGLGIVVVKKTGKNNI